MSELDSQLWNAIEPNNTFKVQALLANGANPNWKGQLGRTAVHRASLLNCPDELELLVNAGGVIDAPDEDQETPLHLAALEGHTGIVSQLLTLGFDLQRTSDYGTPLDRAAYGGRVDVIATLLNAGADVNAKRGFGRTSLHEAANRGYTEAARLLLRRGRK